METYDRPQLEGTRPIKKRKKMNNTFASINYYATEFSLLNILLTAVFRPSVTLG